MLCPYCGERARCIESRDSAGMRVRRYRCPHCDGRCITREILTHYNHSEVLPAAIPRWILWPADLAPTDKIGGSNDH